MNFIPEIEKAIQAGRVPAFAYDRVSTLKQEQEGMSLEYQARHSKKYADENNLQIIQVYSSAESAFKEGRKNFNRMLDDALRCGVRDIIFKNTDRLARNELDWARCKKLARKQGFRIHLYELNTIFQQGSSAEEEVFLDNTSAFAKYWSNKISQSVRRAHEDKRDRGIAGNAPIGYNWDGDQQKYVKNEDSRVIEFAFLHYDDNRISIDNLAQLMNESGLRTANNMLWRKSSVHKVLSNPFYAGKVKRKDGTVYDGTQETYIDWDKYLKRMERMGENWHGEKQRAFDYHLANMLITDDKLVMTGEIKKGKFVYYRYQREGKRDYFREEFIFDLIDKQIQSIVYDDKYSAWMKQEFQAALAGIEADKSGLKKGVLKQIQDIESKQKALFDLFYDADIPKDVLKSKMSDLEKERLYLHKQLERIGTIRKDVLFEIADVIDTLRDFPSKYAATDYTGKAELLRAMSSRIIFTGDTVKIEWKKPFCWIVRVRSTMLPR